MSKKNSSTIVAINETDLGLILNWLKLNKAISASGSAYEMKNGSYAVRVKHSLSKKEIRHLVKERFGMFAKVK